MSIRFEDDTVLKTDDWKEILTLVKEREKQGKSKPTEIKQGSVTIKLKGLQPKSSKEPEHINYIESEHKNWAIRVWAIKKSEVYGCNYFLRDANGKAGQDIRYIEVPFSSVRDENGVFSYVISLIDDI